MAWVVYGPYGTGASCQEQAIDEAGSRWHEQVQASPLALVGNAFGCDQLHWVSS